MTFVAGTGSTTARLGSANAAKARGGPFQVTDAMGAGLDGLAAVSLTAAGSPSAFSWAEFSRMAGDGNGLGITTAWSKARTSTNTLYNTASILSTDGAVDGSGDLIVVIPQAVASGNGTQVRLVRWREASRASGPDVIAGPFTVGTVGTTGSPGSSGDVVRRPDGSYVLDWDATTETVSGSARLRVALSTIPSSLASASTVSAWNSGTTADLLPLRLYVDPASGLVWILMAAFARTTVYGRTYDTSGTLGAISGSGLFSPAALSGIQGIVGEGAVVTRGGAKVLAVPYGVTSTRIDVAYLAADLTSTAPVATETITLASPASISSGMMVLAPVTTAEDATDLVVLFSNRGGREISQVRRTSAGWGAWSTWKDDGVGTAGRYNTVRARWLPGPENVGVLYTPGPGGSDQSFDYLSPTPIASTAARPYAWGWVIG